MRGELVLRGILFQSVKEKKQCRLFRSSTWTRKGFFNGCATKVVTQLTSKSFGPRFIAHSTQEITILDRHRRWSRYKRKS
jgi:hypothetical protein